jgi:hypothetical protein
MDKTIAPAVFLALLAFRLPAFAGPDDMPWIEVSADKRGFVLAGAKTPFTPWGFNYDHDERGRLLEDYWEEEWPLIEEHFAQMKELGANVVRVHLQTGKFLESADQPNEQALARLAKLLDLATREGLYLDLTGLGCYHKQDVPAWYDALSEQGRWDAQARFWEAVAERCSNSPAVFCYDLMNEPVVPGGRRKEGDWLGPPFAGKYFVQCISLDQRDRPRVQIAEQWVRRLSSAIRKHDRRHLITVGMVDWSLDRPGLTSGFVPAKIAPELDFVCVHLYPERGKLDEALATLGGFSVGKPVVIEETFPLKCSPDELDQFVDASKDRARGWISFYWGKSPERLRVSNELGDALLLDWLLHFQRRAKRLAE